ncbi:putative holin-like toxin [Paenibacillus sabuli]|nr:putative holin-like toxin [Paenibacillus sabuli]
MNIFQTLYLMLVFGSFILSLLSYVSYGSYKHRPTSI